jgi:GT2 family glycosyltransferase
MRLSAVVPATNDPPTLARCLAAIRGAADPPEELIVVDGPVGDGPAAARNGGAFAATGDVLVFVDADVEVRSDAFTHIRASFARDPGLTAVFGSYDDRPAAPGVVSAFRNLLHHHVHQTSPGPARTFWAGLGAVRSDVFAELGGFDAARFATPSVEDIDLGMRLSEKGGRILLDPGIQGTHLKAWSVRSMVRTDLLARGVPWVGLLLRHRSGSGALNLGWRHRLSAASCVAGVVALAAQRPLLALVAPLVLVALNHRFYRLLLRRGGPLVLAGGIALHALHHLAAVVALPLGVAVHLGRSRADTRGPAPGTEAG